MMSPWEFLQLCAVSMVAVIILHLVLAPFFALPLCSILENAWRRSRNDEIRLTLWERNKRFRFFLFYRNRLCISIILLSLMAYLCFFAYDRDQFLRIIFYSEIGIAIVYYFLLFGLFFYLEKWKSILGLYIYSLLIFIPHVIQYFIEPFFSYSFGSSIGHFIFRILWLIMSCYLMLLLALALWCLPYYQSTFKLVVRVITLQLFFSCGIILFYYISMYCLEIIFFTSLDMDKWIFIYSIIACWILLARSIYIFRNKFRLLDFPEE